MLERLRSVLLLQTTFVVFKLHVYSSVITSYRSRIEICNLLSKLWRLYVRVGKTNHHYTPSEVVNCTCISINPWTKEVMEL